MALPPILDLAATTFKLSKGDFENNIFFKNALTAKLKLDGSVTTEDGGLTCDETLAYAKNTNFNSARGYDLVGVDPQTEFTAASFTWGEVAGSVPISKREIKINRGKSQIKKLIDKKKDNGMFSAGSCMEDMLFGDGTGNSSKNILGLLAIAPQDSTADTLGGIPSSTQTYWRSKMVSDADSTYTAGSTNTISFASNGIRLMQNMYVAASLGAGQKSPNFILTDSATYMRYQRALLDKIRYTSDDSSMGKYGFTGIQFYGAMMTWTDRIGASAKTLAVDGYDVTFPAAGVMFFLNTEHLYLRQLQAWEAGDFIEPANQRAYTAKIDWLGQFTTDLRRIQGSIFKFVD